MRGLGEAGGGEELLHGGLVHAGGGAEDAGANVCNISKFEEALDGAIFAEWTVQNRKDHIQGSKCLLSRNCYHLVILFPRDKRKIFARYR